MLHRECAQATFAFRRIARKSSPEVRATRSLRRAVAASQNGCPIHVNISMTNGERTYHTPWSPWYEKTQINTPKGERGFCNGEEAVLAGWSAARFQ